jgi:hypothetical protein
MSAQTTGLRVSSVLFAIFAIAHAIRLIRAIPVTIGTVHVPMWVSIIALIVAGFLSTWFWRLASARA